MMVSEQATVGKRALLLLTVASSFLVSISFPPLDDGFCAWFAVAPLLFVLRQRGALAASLFGFLFGTLFGIGAFFWTLNIDVVHVTDFLLFLIAFSLYFSAFGFFYRLISRNLGSWTLIGAPSLWVTLEYIRANLFFLAWPWNLLGHSQHNYLSVIQIADTTGVYGISFVLVMVNQFLSLLPDLFRRQKALSPRNAALQFVAVSLVVTGTFSYGWYRRNIPDKVNGRIRLALVQANLMVGENMTYEQRNSHLMKYIELTRNAARYRPDLIIWPCSSLPAPMSEMYVRFPVLHLAAESNAYLLVGGSGQIKDKPKEDALPSYSNVEFLISPTGTIDGEYYKMRLTPFNEYVPLQGIIPWPHWITSAKYDAIPGTEATIFHAGGRSFGTQICWENMFPDQFRRFVAKGAEFMVTVSSEGFFGKTDYGGPYQTLAMNVFRAVENRVAVARAVSTGVSCFINPNGKIIDRVRDGKGKDWFVSGILIRDIPLSDSKTFYTLYGDVFGYIAIGITMLTILVSAMHFKKGL